MTIRIDRVGISYHPSAEAVRRFSFKVEGLWVEIHELKSRRHSRLQTGQSTLRRFSRLPTLADFNPSPVARRLWSLYSSIYASLEPYVRPVIRSIFIAMTRVGIRCLPLLTQVVDFELERALFTFTTLPEAHITIRSMTLSAALEFSNLESVVGSTTELPRNRLHRRFMNVAHLRSRFVDSFKRIWSHAWGRTQGSAAFSIRIQKVSGFSSMSEWTQFNPDAVNSPRHSCASRFAFVTHSIHNKDMCFDLQDTTELLVSFEVGQTKRIIRDHSISSSLKLPSVQLFAAQFATLLTAVSAARQCPDNHDIVDDPSIVQYKKSVLLKDNRSDRRLPQSFEVSLLRCVDVSLRDISVRHAIHGAVEASPQYFTGHIRSLSVSFEFGEPERTSLHKDFLGNRPDRAADFDTEILSYSFAAKEVTVQRRNAMESVPPSRVISISSIHLHGFATQWTLLNMPAPPIFQGDPNASLLVIKINVLAPQLSERVDVVVDILDHVRKARSSSSIPRVPLRIIRFVPRVMLDIAVDDVAACLTPVERNGTPASSLILSSTQCVMSVSTSFGFFPFAKSTISELQEPGSIPLEFSFSICSLLGPSFVMLLPKPFSLDTSSTESVDSTGVAGIGGDPLLSLSAVELTASGQSLGVLYGEQDEVAVDVASTMTDVRCVTDAISLELWQPCAIHSLIALLDARTDLADQSTQPRISLLDSLPGSVTAHFAVGELGVIVTGKDINPNEDLGLSRGIAVRTGFALQFCSMHDRRNYVRLPRRFTQAHARQRLSLPEELLFEAISISGASSEHPTKFALLRCEMWDAAVRTAVATEFAADLAYDAKEETEDLKSNEFIWVRHVQMNALFKHLSLKDGYNRATEQFQLSVKIPNVRAHIQLFHIYSSLLALHSVRLFSRSRHVAQPPSQRIVFTLKVSITTLQLLLKFPLKERICFRVNGIRMWGSGKHDMTAEWRSLFAWTPSVREREEGKWEELARLRSWKLACNLSEDVQVAFSAAGEAVRLCIPHGYVIADFVLDASILLKCIKHLLKTIPSGMFRSVPPPDAEDAKIVPTINLKIGCISLEVSDDPFESKLGLIWRAGVEAARSRLDREEAFQDKVATIKAAEAEKMDMHDRESRFSPQHTVSIEEAHARLLLVHTLSWIALHREYRDRQKRNEVNVRKELRGEHFNLSGFDVDPMVPLTESPKTPPLLRFITSQVDLRISPPKFPACDLPNYLHDLGKGLPLDSQFTLLIPFHLHMTMGSTCVTLRDYPLPLLNIIQDSPSKSEAWMVDTDFVIAEEVGRESSVVWRECPVVLEGSNGVGAKPLTLSIPKTTMPIKTYANPTVDVLTSQLTEFCWCNSYAPALQDVMRILDTLTTPPPDPSPHLGFWDKIRLALHWRVDFSFASDVRLNLKGSRDPYATDGPGAGFAFCWNGNTRMSVGQANPENEVLQVCSDTMLVVIPEFSKCGAGGVAGEGNPSRFARATVTLNQGLEGRRNSFKKICAKFSSGIKWGIGIVLERKCGEACLKCGGNFSCRLFEFRPHYEVILEPKTGIPAENTPEDSFRGFRSDFIHFSTSLSSLDNDKMAFGKPGSSSFHLTPKTFAHFWSWWGLFDRYLSLPIRQGKLFPNARPPSKKFGRHLATIKYRVGVQRLFISHLYMDDTRESWSEGITHYVGVKALVKSFEADMHQREQEAIVPGVVPNRPKKIRHKPFYAAEVKLTDLQLCAILATFTDPSKRLLDPQGVPKESKYKDVRPDDANNVLRDFWFDMDDFVEIDWEPTEDDPPVYIFPVASCPRFTYFKRTSKQPHRSSTVESSRFGNEDSHVCLMGKEESVHSLQAEIMRKRVSELREHLASLEHSANEEHSTDFKSKAEQIQKKIHQLERHIVQLQEAETAEVSPHYERTGEFAKYLMPSDISFPADWTEFDNVYQAHCPKFSLCNSTRDILMQYYYCSRARRGIEYHMATRAVKYIRDQVNSHLLLSTDTDVTKKIKNPTGLTAQAAANALRKILTHHDNDGRPSQASQASETGDDDEFDPMSGWSDEAVSRNKSHFCLLLKPQVVLRNETTKDSMLVLAALQATLQSHTILDVANIDDPISGRVMTRTHAVLTGLQAFSPSAACRSRHDGVPLEVLLDLRAESSDFDRLVPQTNATFRYDKFNRLRLRNKVTSVVPSSVDQSNEHLQHQTDLIRVHVPRFTVSANSKNFESIADVITTLLLRSDAVHKTHLSKVDTLLFSYDFTDLSAVADVVENIQSRLRRAAEHEHDLESMALTDDNKGCSDLMKMKAHIFLLSEELNLIFEAINLAQQKADDKHSDTKMALKVNTSAREISWGMVDSTGEMIAKLAVKGFEHIWLNRQDGSTVNNLLIVDLQAFDGSRDAEWPEILTKYSEPASHPLVKRGIFMEADWTVLAPVGGITIFERFILDLHPIRLQLEARVGKRIMEYVWPARRDRRRLEHTPEDYDASADTFHHTTGYHRPFVNRRQSVDDASPNHHKKRYSAEGARPLLRPGSRRITSSRSFTDLRGVSRQNSMKSEASVSPSYFTSNRSVTEFPFRETDQMKSDSAPADLPLDISIGDDAAEMKTRSAQKTFVLVRISSMHVLLSFHKDGSFFCRDARIHTRELQYHNQTSSFEELAEQFIPSDMSWRGWMRMALHQPLVPVLPVAREIISKTKWKAGKSKASRQTRKIVKPRPTQTTPENSEQSSVSGSLSGLSNSPNSRKLRREKRAIEATRTNDDNIETSSE
ncbi:FMP27 [Sanghuangporus vaninii]